MLKKYAEESVTGTPVLRAAAQSEQDGAEEQRATTTSITDQVTGYKGGQKKSATARGLAIEEEKTGNEGKQRC